MYAAKENYLEVKDAYLKGKAPVAQLTDAQNVYLSSKLKAANAQYEFFKKLVWVQRSICSVNWAKATPRAKAWVDKIKSDLERMDDITL